MRNVRPRPHGSESNHFQGRREAPQARGKCGQRFKPIVETLDNWTGDRRESLSAIRVCVPAVSRNLRSHGRSGSRYRVINHFHDLESGSRAAAQRTLCLPPCILSHVLLPTAGQAKEQHCSLSRRLKICPFCQESASRDLGTPRRTHLDFEFALRVAIETIHHRRPISDFPH